MGGSRSIEGAYSNQAKSTLTPAAVNQPFWMPMSHAIQPVKPRIAADAMDGRYEVEGVSRPRLLRLDPGHPGVDAPLSGDFSAVRR